MLHLIMLVMTGAALMAQTPDEGKFEVASIKPGNPGSDRVMIQMTPGGGFRAANINLKMLIMQAYGVQPSQVTGGPGWVDSEAYEVVAKGPDGAAHGKSPLEMREIMQSRLQSLLAERFKLVVKRESKEMQGYALVVGKDGIKMTESEASSGERRGMMRMTGRGNLNAQSASTETIADLLSRNLGRKVIDKTGLTKSYDFTLKWSPQPGEGGMRGPGPGPGADVEASGPTIFTAVQEQLGLRLESQKVPVDLIVIESAEKPTEN